MSPSAFLWFLSLAGAAATSPARLNRDQKKMSPNSMYISWAGQMMRKDVLSDAHLKKDEPEYSFEETLKTSTSNLGAEGDASGIVEGADSAQDPVNTGSMAMQDQQADKARCVELSVAEEDAQGKWCQELCATWDNKLVRATGMDVKTCADKGFVYHYDEIPQLEMWIHKDDDKCDENVYEKPVGCNHHFKALQHEGFNFCESFCIKEGQVAKFAEDMGFQQGNCPNEFEKYCSSIEMGIYLTKAPPKDELPNTPVQQPVVAAGTAVAAASNQ